VKISRSLIISRALLSVSVILSLVTTRAQTNAVRARVTEAVDTQNLVTLRGNVHPLARPEFDQGVAPDDLPMERILLVLQRGADQESALRQLLDDQQVKSSPRYHQWLTPAQFGQQFGPADADIQAVTDWLSAQGFQVAKVSSGRTVIEFSGTAGLVRQVLGTEIHRFRVNGEDYWANTSDPQIPAALAPVVAGFASLNNFPRQPASDVVKPSSRSQPTGEVNPLFTVATNGITRYDLGPMDFAIIYNVLPLWKAGTDGTGQTIAIVSNSNINIQDVRDFRNVFGLPANDPQIILNGPDPGITGNENEADLDTQWSGAVAKGATIDLVVSQTTATTNGIELSALYIIDNNLAPVMSTSYGECELFLGAGGNAFYYSIREQGAAQGITMIDSAGDAGSARCDQGTGEVAAEHGLTVRGLASTPFNVAVGGTDFDDVDIWSQYWNSTNSPPWFPRPSLISLKPPGMVLAHNPGSRAVAPTPPPSRAASIRGSAAAVRVLAAYGPPLAPAKAIPSLPGKAGLACPMTACAISLISPCLPALALMTVPTPSAGPMHFQLESPRASWAPFGIL
jgi:subtilase family serine protease